MRKFITGFLLGALMFGAFLFAGEPIANLEGRYLDVLNQRIEKIEQDIRRHEARITALE